MRTSEVYGILGRRVPQRSGIFQVTQEISTGGPGAKPSVVPQLSKTWVPSLSLAVTPPSASEVVSPRPIHESNDRMCFVSQITMRLEAEPPPDEAPRAAGSSWTLEPSPLRANGLHPSVQVKEGTSPRSTPCTQARLGACLAHTTRRSTAF